MSGIADLASHLGIMASYVDQAGTVRPTARETQIALLAAMEVDAPTDSRAAAILAELEAARAGRLLPEWQVVDAGSAPDLGIGEADWRLTLQTGETREGRGALPALPSGRHRIETAGHETVLLSAPRHLEMPRRAWGVTVPLAGLRDPSRGGIGDYGDLAVAAEALARHGAAFVGINPVHAGFPDDLLALSPYSPSHRRRLNILHIGTADEAAPGGELIDFHVLVPRRLEALRRAYAAFRQGGDAGEFEAYRQREGAPLADFALHQALSSRLGPYWNAWPGAFRDPAAPSVRSARGELAEDVRFHAWLQFEAERQLGQARDRAAAAGMEHGLYLDLAVGTHPFGAETWLRRPQFADGASLGAPPDDFAPDGQEWGLAPFNPVTLIRQEFRPLADTLRKQLQFAGLLRIDHILGFDRAFWVPAAEKLPGAYVRMPRDAMLAVTRMEAAAAGATIIGEDLGNIPDGLQHALADSGILGCRLLVFEHRMRTGGGFVAPHDYAPGTLASFSTHDLPTWLGWRKAADIRLRRALEHIDAPVADWLGGERSAMVAAFDAETLGDKSVDAMHAFLARTASSLVALQIEDLLEVEEQPNLPGTIHEYPNWRRRLPVGAAAFEAEPRIERAAQTMKRSGR